MVVSDSSFIISEARPVGDISDLTLRYASSVVLDGTLAI